MNVVQASVLAMEPLKTEEFRINLHGAIIKKDNEEGSLVRRTLKKILLIDD